MAHMRIWLALVTLALAGPADAGTATAGGPLSDHPSATKRSFFSDKKNDSDATQDRPTDTPEKPRAGWNGFYGGLNAGGAKGAASDP